MDDLRDFEGSEEPRMQKPLSEQERRQMLQKRIDELRRRKKRERRKSVHPILRVLPVILLIGFFFLCLISSLVAYGDRGGGDAYLSTTLAASNGERLEAVAMDAGSVKAPDVPAVAAYLLDPDTGDVLYEKNAQKSYAMASTTKIMTAIVAIENSNLSDSVVISEHAATVGESSAWLSKGETLTIEQLLYALLLQSANDAAVALAEGVAGSEQAFVDMMNQKAAELGAVDTHFANPHGLDQPGHYTSASNLAMIMAYAMRNSTFRQIVQTKRYELAWPGHPFPRVLENHNKLLSTYEWATGGKTGYTVDAGKCLVASAAKDGRQLISVVLNGGDGYWDDSVKLLNYGFDSFTRVEYAYSSEPLAQIYVGNFPSHQVNAVSESDLVFTIRRDYLRDFDAATVYYREHLSYPVDKGEEIGYMVVAEGSPAEKRVSLVSDTRQTAPNIISRSVAFSGSVLAVWWKGLKWIIPGI
jgi:serine-type D-Ala-D-Ala carboxypeptidase (penicillin-binding protein 5/6)